MKTLNITFTENEYLKLFKAKRLYAQAVNSNISWHKFIMLKCANGVSAWRKPNRVAKEVRASK